MVKHFIGNHINCIIRKSIIIVKERDVNIYFVIFVKMSSYPIMQWFYYIIVNPRNLRNVSMRKRYVEYSMIMHGKREQKKCVCVCVYIFVIFFLIPLPLVVASHQWTRCQYRASSRASGDRTKLEISSEFGLTHPLLGAIEELLTNISPLTG